MNSFVHSTSRDFSRASSSADTAGATQTSSLDFEHFTLQPTSAPACASMIGQQQVLSPQLAEAADVSSVSVPVTPPSVTPPSTTPLRGSPTASPPNASPPGESAKKEAEMESLDYDVLYSSIFEKDFLRQSSGQRQAHLVSKWVVCMLCGLTTGALAFVLDMFAELLQDWKWQLAALGAGPDAGGYARAAVVYTAYCAVLVAFASALVLHVEPIAAGSGIPEVKAYLQGCRLPRMLRITTLACKSIGVLCSVAAGLICGKEGPMIHAGAIIAGGLSQGSSKTFRLRTMMLKRFRNDHDKRDFVSAGAAAGVAAAFGAPIGGVLFAMEEAATHWSQALTWRTFFCALSATFSLNLLLSLSRRGMTFGQLSHPGLLTFGSFLECQGDDHYSLGELVRFGIIGVACGLVGALFNVRGSGSHPPRARALHADRPAPTGLRCGLSPHAPRSMDAHARSMDAHATRLTVRASAAPILRARRPSTGGSPSGASGGWARRADGWPTRCSW